MRTIGTILIFGDEHARLLVLRERFADRSEAKARPTIMDLVRLEGRQHLRESKAMAHWFSLDEVTYNEYRFRLNQYLQTASMWGLRSLKDAEKQWDLQVEKHLESFAGGYWMGSKKPRALISMNHNP